MQLEKNKGDFKEDEENTNVNINVKKNVQFQREVILML